MPSEYTGLVAYAAGLALVAARVMGTFFFVPFPGPAKGAALAKTLLTLAITFALFPLWPTPDPSTPIAGYIIFGILKEAAVGISLGLVISIVNECFTFAFHVLGQQAGYSYASTIDPTSNADSTVLESIGHIAAGMLMFTTGLMHHVVRAFAVSLEVHPAGTWTLGPNFIPPVLALFQAMLSAGVRLALPIIASMLLIDLALALAARVATNLQLVMLSFPVKMLVALVLIAWLLQFLPSVFIDLSTHALETIQGAMKL